MPPRKVLQDNFMIVGAVSQEAQQHKLIYYGQIHIRETNAFMPALKG